MLVDFPTAEGVRTLADERATGARPYFTRYPAGSILGWRTTRGESGLELSQLRLMECVTEDVGEWSEKEVHQVRVLYPGRWEVWRKIESGANAGNWALYKEGLTSIRRIPFVFFYGLRHGFGVGMSPLLDLAHLNVEHWQSASDQQNILHVARVPILFAKGFTEGDQIVVGAASAVRAMSTEASLSYVEHSGKAIEAGRQSLLDIEDRMRQAGAELLVQRPLITTATQVSSEAEGGRSILQSIAEGFEESLEECVRLMAEWLNQSADPEIELYKDFGSSNMAEKTGDLLLRAADGGIVSKETAFKELQRIDVISPEVEWEKEMARLAALDAAEEDEGEQDTEEDDTEGDGEDMEDPPAQ
ncbi:DUF4055 domain-containing protein [Methylocystis sp. WRRC1]|uniref:DUF4055 domain-containing protein n=1 Tax=Methylocystis sp. WRRC1 TaxID=1732014 RepID=UPI001D13DDAE|nr:DUF4055 domain-containing protein [Methylocystis sp. WRRC1]